MAFNPDHLIKALRDENPDTIYGFDIDTQAWDVDSQEELDARLWIGTESDDGTVTQSYGTHGLTLAQAEAKAATGQASFEAAKNKSEAKALLAATDWSVLPDASSALANASAFTTYRSALRALIANPTANATFPEVPDAEWS
jgi:hypothetical protein